MRRNPLYTVYYGLHRINSVINIWDGPAQVSRQNLEKLNGSIERTQIHVRGNNSLEIITFVQNRMVCNEFNGSERGTNSTQCFLFLHQFVMKCALFHTIAFSIIINTQTNRQSFK